MSTAAILLVKMCMKNKQKNTETIQRLLVGMMKEGYRYEHASFDVEGQDQYESLFG